MAAPAYTDLSLAIATNWLAATATLPSTLAGIPQINGSPWNLQQVPTSKLTQGATAGKFDVCTKLYVVSATGATNYDLTALLDPLGATINFASVRGYAIWNFGVTAGYVLKIDGTVSNAWLTPFDSIATAKAVVQPGYTDSASVIIPGFLCNQGAAAAGMAVGPTNKVISINAGANTIVHGLFVWGISA